MNKCFVFYCIISVSLWILLRGTKRGGKEVLKRSTNDFKNSDNRFIYSLHAFQLISVTWGSLLGEMNEWCNEKTEHN